MAIQYKYGEEEVKALAQQAGKAQAANIQLQQRFQKDMAMMEYQLGLEKQRRAMAWDMEKMEIASRNDFEREERERVNKQDQWAMIKKQISETDILTPEQKEQALYNNFIKLHGGVPEQTISPYQQELLNLRKAELESDPTYMAMQELKRQQEAPQVETPASSVPQAVAQNQPKVSTSPVPLGSVAPKDVPQENGRFIVTSPSGAKQTIRPDEYDWAIEQGYTVQPIVSSDLWNSFFGGTKKPSLAEIPSEPIPGVGFGGAGYKPNKKREKKPNPLLQLIPGVR